VALIVLGPRRFARVSPWLHALVVASILAGLVYLPQVSTSTVDTLARTGAHVEPWILSSPPLWFLGLYERILRTDDPVLRALANRAIATMLISGALTVITFALAYRNRDVLLALPGASARPGWWSRMTGRVVLVLDRRQVTRASMQFFL